MVENSGVGGVAEGGRGIWGKRVPISLLLGFLKPCLVITFSCPDTQNPLCKLQCPPQSTAAHKPEPSQFGFPKSLAGEPVGGGGGAWLWGNLHG